jgi:hypothetical protein
VLVSQDRKQASIIEVQLLRLIGQLWNWFCGKNRFVFGVCLRLVDQYAEIKGKNGFWGRQTWGWDWKLSGEE